MLYKNQISFLRYNSTDIFTVLLTGTSLDYAKLYREKSTSHHISYTHIAAGELDFSTMLCAIIINQQLVPRILTQHSSAAIMKGVQPCYFLDLLSFHRLPFNLIFHSIVSRYYQTVGSSLKQLLSFYV